MVKNGGFDRNWQKNAKSGEIAKIAKKSLKTLKIQKS